MSFSTSNTERIQINNSGNIGFSGVPASNPSKVNISGSTSSYSTDYLMRIETSSANAASMHMIAIRDNAGNVDGSCILNGTASSTSWNTSSDYRMKENAVVLPDGLSICNALKPYKFNMINSDIDQFGFFAHEVAEQIPEAISGEKDAMYVYEEEDEIPEGKKVGDDKIFYLYYTEDDDVPEGKNIGDEKEGTEHTKILRQQMDYGRITPVLCRAIQELSAKNDALEARVTALESA